MDDPHPIPRDDPNAIPRDDEPARARSVRGANDALARCLAGDAAGGLARYRDAITSDVVDVLPLGLHARLIEQAGDADTARALRGIAVRHGFDVAWQTAHRTRGPAADAETYAALFAQGYCNPLMIDRYLGALTRLGRTAEVAALFDVPRLLHRTTVGDAEAVAAALEAMEAALPYADRVQISYAMRSLDDLHLAGVPAFDALLEQVRGEMAAWLARFGASDHPLAAMVPQDFRIEAWGMVARAAGHNVRHHHPRGWATAVYYPRALPPGSVGGTLRIGGWSDPAPPGWPDATIVPEPGLLVLMPSWYVHWTDPTGSSGARLSIAIDAVRGAGPVTPA